MNVVDLVILNTIPPEKYIFDPFPLVVLSAGIAPTLIMVRAKLGMNIESTQEAVSEIRFTSQPAQRGAGGTSTVYSQAQVLSIAPNSEGGMEGGEERAGNAKVTFAIA
ncbi:hypothetical protein VNI00_018357 [Paramarasmius palmivorus]|uniref:Uncharacterized protein n=1 Tax=Paramarasmius palmivorus TaxID=297713 RepID=A0AAW0AYL9_9AGAR